MPRLVLTQVIMPVEDVAAMFGKTEGFKASDPVVTPREDDEDDF